jgi:hypothetical protein
MTTKGSLSLTIDAQQLSFDVGPMQGCLFGGRALLFGAREDCEGDRPHRCVTAKFGDEPRELLVEEWRHV